MSNIDIPIYSNCTERSEKYINIKRSEKYVNIQREVKIYEYTEKWKIYKCTERSEKNMQVYQFNFDL